MPERGIMSSQHIYIVRGFAASLIVAAVVTSSAFAATVAATSGEPTKDPANDKVGLAQKAGHAQRCNAAQKDCGPAQKHCAVPKPACEYRWETIMKTCTRTVFEDIHETRHKTLYDTHFDYQTVHDVTKVPEIQYRQEEYTYQVPILEPRTREVNYTTYHTLFETRTKNVNYVTYLSVPEQHTRSVPYTIYHTVPETGTRTMTYTVPRHEPYTETISVPTGHYETHVEEHPGPVMKKCVQEPGCWKWDPCKCCCVYVPGKSKIVEVQCPPKTVSRKVWVPRIEQKLVHRTRTVYETRTKQVPYTTYRSVPETRTRQVDYTVYKRIPINHTRTVHYQVSRRVPQQHTRTETYMVKRMVTEVGTKNVPFTTYLDVPTTRTVCVPRTVPRTVTYTVTRRVPRTETYEVPVRICRPVGCDTPHVDGDYHVVPPAEASDDESDSANAEEIAPGTEVPEAEPPADDDSAPGTAATSSEAAARLEQDAESFTSVEATHPAVFTAAAVAEPRVLFSRGLRDYWQSDFAAAAPQLQQAATAEPKNARYAYFWALALRQSGDLKAADTALTEAVKREAKNPLPHFGRMMERVQGEHRLWLEAARKPNVN